MASPPTLYKIPDGGTLRGDAAASYLRMRAAGMPAGGVDVWSRTPAQQAALRKRYEAGLGPLAAKPTPTAPHIRGVAMDLQTTRSGVYNPSSAHVWLSAGGNGQQRPARAEKLRCHAYGWRRTVPSERWHYAYDPRLDTKAKADLAARLKVLGFSDVRAFQRAKKLTVDGVAGPQTWTALLLAADAQPKPAPPADPLEVPVPVDPKPPVTPPAEPVTAVLNLGVANCQSYGGDNSEKAYRARARIMASKGWTVVAVCETTRAGRDWMCDELRKLTGHRWAFEDIAGKTVGVLWDDEIWSAKASRWRRFGNPATAFGQGALVQPLLHRLTRIGIDVGSIHVRPKSIATDAQKRSDVALAKGLTKSWPIVWAGDFALDDAPMTGYIRVTPVVDTVKSDGGANSRVDAGYIRGKVGAGESVVVDPGPLSDHKWLGVQLILGGSTS